MPKRDNIMPIDVKKTFLRYLFLSRFYVFNFFIFRTFFK